MLYFGFGVVVSVLCHWSDKDSIMGASQTTAIQKALDQPNNSDACKKAFDIFDKVSYCFLLLLLLFLGSLLLSDGCGLVVSPNDHFFVFVFVFFLSRIKPAP